MKRWTCQTVQNETKVTDLLNLRNSFETQMLINLNLIQLCKYGIIKEVTSSRSPSPKGYLDRKENMYKKFMFWIGGFILGGVFVSIAGKIENPVEILSLIILGCLCSLNWD